VGRVESYGAVALAYAAILPTSEKGNSPKSNCRILYKRCPSGRVLLLSSTPTHPSQHYMLWR